MQRTAMDEGRQRGGKRMGRVATCEKEGEIGCLAMQVHQQAQKVGMSVRDNDVGTHGRGVVHSRVVDIHTDRPADVRTGDCMTHPRQGLTPAVAVPITPKRRCRVSSLHPRTGPPCPLTTSSRSCAATSAARYQIKPPKFSHHHPIQFLRPHFPAPSPRMHRAAVLHPLIRSQ